MCFIKHLGTTTENCQTRMHSRRMRTSRSWSVCWGLLPGGGVCSGGSLVGGGVCSWGEVWYGGVSGPGGVSAPGGRSGMGGSWSQGGISQHALRQTPPPVDRHTPVKILSWPNFVAAGNKRLPLPLLELKSPPWGILDPPLMHIYILAFLWYRKHTKFSVAQIGFSVQ